MENPKDEQILNKDEAVTNKDGDSYLEKENSPLSKKSLMRNVCRP